MTQTKAIEFHRFNAFRCTKDRSLDMQYLRVSAVYRLLSRGRIGKARACELLAERKVEQPKRLVELWLNECSVFKGRKVAA